MTPKRDFKFLLTYSDRFVEQATAAIFKEQQFVTGTELKTCTPVKQVNYFIIKYVYESWQATMQQLEHPYFDYTARAVQEARFEFGKAVSNHTRLAERYFRPLAKKATMDTLTLMFYPDLFFKTFTARYSQIIQIQQEVLPVLKYIKIHLPVINAFKNIIESEQTVSKSFLQEALKAARQGNRLDNLETSIRSFNQVVELESLDTSQAERTAVEQEEAQINNLLQEVEKVKPTEKPAAEVVSEDVELEPKDKNSTVIERLQEEQEKPKPTLHQQLQSQEKEANDTVLDRLQKQQKKANFISTISIIDKTRFLNLLFNENRADYEKVIGTINDSANYQEVMKNFQRYFREYNWSLTDEATKDLLAYINNYF